MSTRDSYWVLFIRSTQQLQGLCREQVGFIKIYILKVSVSFYNELERHRIEDREGYKVFSGQKPKCTHTHLMSRV